MVLIFEISSNLQDLVAGGECVKLQNFMLRVRTMVGTDQYVAHEASHASRKIRECNFLLVKQRFTKDCETPGVTRN